MADSALLSIARAWMGADPDPVTRAELESLIADGGETLAERFADRLQFGTAGLRGALGAGPTRMNRVIVRSAAAGVVQYLIDLGVAERGIVIGCDARHNSDLFALDTARVAAAMGVRARLLPRQLPTPVLAFAVRHLGAAAGVMVTASHNPPGDNGYKVYLGDGAQIVTPHDSEISARIDAAGLLGEDDLAEVGDELISEVDVTDAYLDAVCALPFTGHRSIRVAYTAMHGVGAGVATAAFERCGFPALDLVAEQCAPDPEFSTVSFPNPEEPGAMDLLLATAQRTGAALAIANDPDADRLGAAVPLPDGTWRALRGDEIGWLLADHVLRHTHGDDRLVATTLVSSTLLGKMAAAHGIGYAETLTGFKWIARAIADAPERRFVFGYEQALGYLVGEVVRDKDGISAALVLAEAAAEAAAEGTDLLGRLDAIADRFGRHATAERSLRMEPAAQHALMERLRAHPPGTVAGWPVTEMIDRRDGNVVMLRLGTHGRVLVRPSGTEPKIKLYAEAIDGDPAPMLDDLAAVLAG